MFNPVKSGPAREVLSARVRLDQEELRRLHESNALIIDDRRRRPLYFDGRFLAARDLTREQNYFLTRQSDLGRAGGAGVVQGLMVSSLEDGRRLRIAPGHGITPLGESVVLPQPLTLDLTNIPEMERLDAVFGLRRRPSEPVRNRTGLFVLALRAVEFPANPIASYPTSLTGDRSVQEGDVIEAVAATLIPFPDPGGDGELSRRRARTARTLFAERSAGGLPVDALPLAMVALERNVVHWLDVFMVRREVGSDHGDVLGLGLAPRAVREAHLIQYDQHLLDVLRDRDASGRGRRFAAGEHFLALPPGGRLPVQAVNPVDFTQSFFPPEVTVELSIVPEDEVPALLEESLLLPPIDLTLDGEALGSTGVLVLIPVPAARVRRLRATLERLTLPLGSAASGLLAQQRPIDVLRGILPARAQPALLPPETLANRAWAAELANAATTDEGLLWYVRRRNVDYRSDSVGIAVSLEADEIGVEEEVSNTLRSLELDQRVESIRSASTSLARGRLESLLATPRVTDTPLLARALVTELETAKGSEAPPAPESGTPPADGGATGTTETTGTAGAPTAPSGAVAGIGTLDRRAILEVEERFSSPTSGEGIKRIEEALPGLTTDPAKAEVLAASRLVPEMDRAAATLPEAELVKFAAAIDEAAATGEPELVRETILKTSPTLTTTTSPTLSATRTTSFTTTSTTLRTR